MRTLIPAAAAILIAASPAIGQSASDHIALGDREYTAMNAPAALAHYEEALAADPKSYDALWKAARSDVDLGQYEKDDARREALFSTAEQRARLATQVNPADAEGHFVLALALGRRALTLGPRDRVKYGKEVRTQALDCLRINPNHAGCMHVMGVWNAEVMRLNGFTRMIAKHFLGGQIFNEANWSSAQRYMEQSVANDPNRIAHHLDLGRVYADLGKKGEARAQFQAVIDGPLTDYNDKHYKAEAAEALKRL